MLNHMDSYGGFQKKWGTRVPLVTIRLNGIFPHKPSILGDPWGCRLWKPVAKAQNFPLVQHDDLFGHGKVRGVGQIQEVVPRGVLRGERQPELTYPP